MSKLSEKVKIISIFHYFCYFFNYLLQGFLCERITYVETWARELIPSLECTCRFCCACSILGICMVVCYFVYVVNVLSLSHVLSLLTRGHNSHEPIVEGLNIRLSIYLSLPITYIIIRFKSIHFIFHFRLKIVL